MTDPADDYLDLCLRGEVPDLEVFLAEHPGLSEAQIERLRLLSQSLGAVAVKPTLDRLGEYRILHRIDSGGMGIVYLAEQESLGRRVALKVIRPELSDDVRTEQRFEREIQSIARLNHPNIVQIFGAGEEQGVQYLAMEHISGIALDEWLDQTDCEQRDLPQILRWMQQLASALQCAHEAGIVHRDVKPSNILIGDDGRAMLLDFGLAQLNDGLSLSVSGQFRGTPQYAAPEQVQARKDGVDARADVYALGTTLYEGATGEIAFRAESTAQLFHQILHRDPAPPCKINPRIPRDLQTVILTAMEKEPRHRYQSAAKFEADLEALLLVRPIAARSKRIPTRCIKWMRRRPIQSTALAVGSLAIVVLLGLMQWQRIANSSRVDQLIIDAKTAAAHLSYDSAQKSIERALALVSASDPARAHELRELQTGFGVSQRTANAAVEVDRYVGTQTQVLDLESKLKPLHFGLRNRYLKPSEQVQMNTLENQLRQARQASASASAAIDRNLDAALALAPNNEAVLQLQARAHLERWRSAVHDGDSQRRDQYRARLEALPKSLGTWRSEVAAMGQFSLITEPSGVEVNLYRYREQATLHARGDTRLVPVPIHGEEPLLPAGQTAVRVTRGAGELEPGDYLLKLSGHHISRSVFVLSSAHKELRPGDRLISIDGVPVGAQVLVYLMTRARGHRIGDHDFLFQGESKQVLRGATIEDLGLVLGNAAQLAQQGRVSASWFRDGESSSGLLPRGLRVRTTAAPTPLSSKSSIGVTPVARQSLEAGSYLAILRCADGQIARLPFVIRAGQVTEQHLDLTPLADIPDDFVRVPASKILVGGDPLAFSSMPQAEVHVDEFWIMDREVLAEEYLVFLNDPETLREIRSSRDPIRYPRSGGVPRLWVGSPTKGYQIPMIWRKQPILGISWNDAKAYAEWRTARARAAGKRIRLSLPTDAEWEKAACGADRRAYPYGDRFNPTWMKSKNSRPSTIPEPGLNFPIDESPYGVFDMGGSLTELVGDQFSPGNYVIRGGAWQNQFPDLFRCASRLGTGPLHATLAQGIRLVLHVER